MPLPPHKCFPNSDNSQVINRPLTPLTRSKPIQNSLGTSAGVVTPCTAHKPKTVVYRRWTTLLSTVKFRGSKTQTAGEIPFLQKTVSTFSFPANAPCYLLAARVLPQQMHQNTDQKAKTAKHPTMAHCVASYANALYGKLPTFCGTR